MSHTMVGRDVWGAREVSKVYMLDPAAVRHVTIHYLGAPTPADDPEERRCRRTQDYHIDTRGWTDVAYNYMVGQSGRAYVGRGRRRKNAADGGAGNKDSLSVCALLGTVHTIPSDAMLATLQSLVWELAEEFPAIKSIRPHKAWKATSCPGPALTARLKAGEFTLRRPIPAPSPPPPPPAPVEPDWDALRIMHDAGMSSDDIRKLARAMASLSETLLGMVR